VIDDQLDQNIIPDTWTWTLIKDLGEVVGGGTPSTKVEENFNGDIAWLTPADLSGYTKKYITSVRLRMLGNVKDL